MSPRRPLPVRRIVTSLVIGLFVTIALAWVSMFVPSGRQWYGPPAVESLGLAKTSDNDRTWQIERGRNAWHHVVQYWHMQVSGLSLMMPQADYEARRFDLAQLPDRLKPASLDELKMLAWYHETGFPLPALTCSVHWKTQVRNADIIYIVRGGVQLPRDAAFNPRALPCVPVWPGSVLDVLAWALAWFLAVTLLVAIRAWLRTRRGRCRHCGYPRTGRPEGSNCPECGRAP